MCRFIETIRIEGGRAWNLDLHNRRMNATRAAVWGGVEPLRLEDVIHPGGYAGRTRCRVVYGREVEQVEYFPYRIRPVKSLTMVDCDEADYRYKSADRSLLDRLFALRGAADDVLIVRCGLITDTSIANVALWDGEQWLTPSRPLLCGTQRAALLAQGVLAERDIPAAEVGRYQKIRLFNAMIPFGEVELPCAAVSRHSTSS